MTKLVVLTMMIDVASLRAHPIAAEYPMAGDNDFEALKASILERGLQQSRKKSSYRRTHRRWISFARCTATDPRQWRFACARRWKPRPMCIRSYPCKRTFTPWASLHAWKQSQLLGAVRL